MAKSVYCSECGKQIPVSLKAVKGSGRIFKLIDPHVCSEEPVPIDLDPIDNQPAYEGERKFVQNLDNLAVVGAMSTHDLRDRRPPDQVKSTAPISIAEQIKAMQNTSPEGDIGNEPEGS